MLALPPPPPPPPEPRPVTEAESSQVIANKLMAAVAELENAQWQTISFTKRAEDTVREAAAILAKLCSEPLVTPSQLPPGKCIDNMYVFIFYVYNINVYIHTMFSICDCSD